MTPPTGWAVPTWPHEPTSEPLQTVVDNAYLTPIERGPLHAAVRPDRWITGAVYDADGALVRHSLKLGGLGGARVVAADRPRTRLRRRVRRLRGTWLYGGHWVDHFGHFMTETLTTLWPANLHVDGLLFHAFGPAHDHVADWERAALDLTAYAGLPVEVVKAEPLRVDRLHVPSRGLVVNGWADPGAVEVWSHMARAAGGPEALVEDGPRVFVSRTAFNARQRAAGKPVRASVEVDLALDRAFADAGFEVVAPEALGVSEQVRLAAGASVMAGSAGTALHLSAFAPAGCRVIEIGDTRSPGWPVPQQQVIDCARRHPSAYDGRDVPLADYPSVLRGLGLSD